MIGLAFAGARTPNQLDAEMSTPTFERGRVRHHGTARPRYSQSLTLPGFRRRWSSWWGELRLLLA
jgi:hypothetical protein